MFLTLRLIRIELILFLGCLPGQGETLILFTFLEDFGADAHTASWLSTEEYRKCLDFHFRILSERKELSIEHIREWVEQYEKIYDYMEYSENEGEPSRIVFWFDN